ncbi:PAP/25A-associated [Parasponia andersonii]|uniref:PAP/25A-associated n=1 Tax=Parasponia andersonii TaxID=3476 RepID=A0A2P5E0E9_PARAD|nr:PAP/25A-associated [Parasponia andersonii]
MEDFQENLSPSSSLSSTFSILIPDPLSIDAELWLMAEQRTQEILCIIQPNIVSDKRRKEISNYVRKLIKGYFGTEVLSFGSVPLKTYLPDGDIDLTAFSYQNLVEDLAKEVCTILKCDEDSEFQVKGVQYIHAQVKIVKCTVKNIAVDISFNQVAGLCTLCFMEQVDQLIGKDHLFKCSVILTKAWCYYESRILGAHHGLISTYALETLVLYIINLFHASLRGPLEVLYRFLEYYGTFDWDNYCISINGPIALSSLTEITTERVEDDDNKLILSKEFLKNCRDMFSDPIRANEAELHEFPIKRLNILDPLNDNNNLGRSVSKGNFHRIRCALSYGAQKLGEILMLPGVSMGEGLEKFFMNTLDRNGRGERPDVQVPVPAFGTGRCELYDLSGDYDSYYGGLQYTQLYHDYFLTLSMQPSLTRSYVWDENTLAWTVQHNRNGFHFRGTEVFVPRMPFDHPNSSQLPPATFGTFRTGRSRGTGTYIPEMTHHLYKDVYKRVRKSNAEPVQHNLPLKSAQKSDGDDNHSEKGKGSRLLDLSLEEFPFLPNNANSIPSEISQPGELALNTLPHKHSSPTFRDIEFGTFRRSPSPLGLHSRLANEQADSVISYSFNPLRDVPAPGVEKQQEILESDEDTIPVRPYELEAD